MKPSVKKTPPKAGSGQTHAKAGLASRQAAAKILAAVIDRKVSLDGMLDQENGNPAYRALNDADKALVRAALNSALRHLPRIDAIFAELLKSPLPEGARALQMVLYVAAAQILYLDIPDHSAVDLAVEQANLDPRNRRFAGLVNAVLRRLGREKEELLAKVSQLPSLPQWFFERLVEVYGAETASEIAEAQLSPAAVDLTVKSDPEGWAQRLGGKVLPTGSVRLSRYQGAIPDLDGYTDGAWWVQDAAASIPAQLFGDIAGSHVVDLCAAPGGKTAQLIARGASVTALDQSANRLKRLGSNLARLGMEAVLVEANAASFKPDALFDAALLDAPCSSTGTVRRHPDVPWTKTMADVEKLARVQEGLLLNALDVVRPGGFVIFSNCSLDPLEGEFMVRRVLKKRADARLVAIDQAVLPGLSEAFTADGEIRTTPAMLRDESASASGMDGFYAAKLQRI
ncbi:RsmB/NOP family class I SAM-dependent RNA methyltransferase [Rhizobium sp. L1K21]|uniref:RsmB/NOP family class I SAM-dependent RNA methyltransferase n=1 Tax=Rhizobium sp. L1K21 TaxID=2954933 RepID=UPI002093DA6D|nr:RsmB/NOP family class I SAM-dependent RNA methyltransferase [Rhizobium sp. L1K21]MCO6188024.1 MFS transporter [Rhizobium sp. L1K21]